MGLQVESQDKQLFDWGYYLRFDDQGWLAFYDYFQKIGIVKHEGIAELIQGVKSGVFLTIQLDGICFVCGKPDHIKRDALHNLHSESGSAISWPGFELFYLWGVNFTQEEHEKLTQGKLSTKDIINIKDIDKRMAAMKYLKEKGINILTELGAKLIDSKKGYDLFLVENVFPTQKQAYFLRYYCPSTKREYISGIDPKVGAKRDALESILWKFEGTTAIVFANSKQS